jgi:hypothetical protein
MIFPQPLMLAICALIPVYFIYMKKRHDWAVCWLAIIIVLDIFNSQLYMNLSALLIFGMMAIPYVWNQRGAFKKNTALKLFLVYFLYLSLLGIYHGFFKPWPDPTGLRSIKDQAQFRTILHLGRTFCEWIAALYLTLQIERSQKETLDKFLKTAFYCSILLVLGTAAEKWLRIDFYHFFTGGRALLLEERPRGLTYEPRGLSQNLAYAILLTPFVPLPKWKYLWIPVFAFFGFFITISFTGLAILAVGLAIAVSLLAVKERALIRTRWKETLFLGVGMIALIVGLFSILPKSAVTHLSLRFDYLFQSDVAEKFEVFDAASINFLNHNPKYYLLGTGPGLIYLPAGDYILERDRYIWGNHFEALPHVGSVLILSNSGILGLTLFLTALLVAARTKTRKQDLILFIIGCTLCGVYMFQIRYFFIFGVACLLANTKRESKQAIFK